MVMKTKGNVLFISSHLPSLAVPQAGQKIAYEMLRGYATGYNVYLVAFCNEVERNVLNIDDLSFCKDVNLFHVGGAERLRSVVTNILMPVRAAVRVNPDAAKKIVDLQRSVGFDIVHFEFTSAGYYVKYITGAGEKIITEHDVTYQAVERKVRQVGIFCRPFYRLEYLRQKKWELAMLSMMDVINVLSEKDRNILIGDGIAAEKIRTKQPRVNPAFGKVTRDSIEKNSILLWGAMNREENVDAALWFIDDIFPLIARRFGDAKLYVVGTHPPTKLVSRSSRNVVVTGFVENPLAFFAKCNVAIAPIRIGAGIKIKVLEYLEAGLPVVATSVGAEGITHEKLVVANDEGQFAEAVISILSGDNA